jgi:hypothetical protein
MTRGFVGRHSETGTIVDALAAMGVRDPKTGKAYSEALALGASGGIAFGYFVFEYKGYLPHVALLTRNTFSPFDRSLDNLAIRRESRETTDAARAEKNLRAELDLGNPVIVWADAYSLPHTGLCADQMWAMRPLLVVGQEGSDFLVVDRHESAFPLSAEVLSAARSRVKKDRHRMMTLEAPDEERVAEGLLRGIETCLALFLDKPPAGSPNNFGFTGMRNFAAMLVDDKTAKGWGKTFAPGPRLVNALAGEWGQPGIADWIERWGTSASADRDVFAQFLEEAAAWAGIPEVAAGAAAFRESASLWRRLADEAMSDAVDEFRALKTLKQRHSEIWISQGLASLSERASIRNEMANLTARAAESAVLAREGASIRRTLSELVDAIADVEEPLISGLRRALLLR